MGLWLKTSHKKHLVCCTFAAHLFYDQFVNNPPHSSPLAAIYAYLGTSLHFSFAVSLCLGVSMVLAMVVSSLSGTLIPVFFQRIGIEPEVASGLLITTVNDLVAWSPTMALHG